MALLPLSNGGHVQVDDEDYERLAQWKWRRNPMGYVQRDVRVKGKRIGIYLHKLVMGTEINGMVDHINRDKLDCRKSNLRPATRSQNCQNAAKRSRPTTSRYKGVSRSGNRWRVQLMASGHRYQCQCATEEEAARAWDELARAHHGAFAVLNFPD